VLVNLKGNNVSFSSRLEKVIVDIWGDGGEQLSTHHLNETRKALSFIRRVYRHHGEHGTIRPSRINYKFKQNRAGYLAAFGEKHAYLSYLHLKKVQTKNPEAIPQPKGKRNELVITSLGAGACVELFGICLFYLLDNPNQPFQLRLNAIEKESQWNSSQHIVFNRVLKDFFHKVDVNPTNIESDLTENAIPAFADKYDKLIDTDILLIYNVLNEITSIHSQKVWRNIRFLLDIFQKPVLILLMEPSAPNAEPRIYVIKEQLAQQTELIEQSKEEIFHFTQSPVSINIDDSISDLNYRLFKLKKDGARLDFETYISRAHLSALKKPDSPITNEQMARQLSILGIKRTRKGSLAYRRGRVGPQYTFVSISDEWKLD